MVEVGDGYEGEHLIFVVGCPRSGTTWLQRLLAQHPLVSTGQESDLFDLYIGPLIKTWRRELLHDTSGRGVGLKNYMDEEWFLTCVRAFAGNLLRPMIAGVPADGLFVEKTPSHAVYMREIDEILPSCRFVHVIRDPRDVTASLLAAYSTWGRGWAPSTARRAIKMWVEHVGAARAYGRILSPSRYFEIRYEDLHESPLSSLGELATGLGLMWEESGLRAALRELSPGHSAAIAPFQARDGQQGEPEGFVRKASPGSWREELSRRDLFWVRKYARQMMGELGYR